MVLPDASEHVDDKDLRRREKLEPKCVLKFIEICINFPVGRIVRG